MQMPISDPPQQSGRRTHSARAGEHLEVEPSQPGQQRVLGNPPARARKSRWDRRLRAVHEQILWAHPAGAGEDEARAGYQPAYSDTLIL